MIENHACDCFEFVEIEINNVMMNIMNLGDYLYVDKSLNLEKDLAKQHFFGLVTSLMYDNTSAETHFSFPARNCQWVINTIDTLMPYKCLASICFSGDIIYIHCHIP